MQAAEPITTLQAQAVHDSWGVCGRPGLDASIPLYAAMLRQLDTRNVRSPLMDGGGSSLPRFQALAQAMRRADPANAGPRVTAIVTAYLNDPVTTWPAEQAALIEFAKAGLLAAIEGPNELNNALAGLGSHGPFDRDDRTGPHLYPANALAWARAIAAFRNAHRAALPGVVLVAPSIASGLPAEFAALPNLSALADAGNIHFYAGGGRQPSFSIPPNPAVGSMAAVLAWARAAEMPGGPMWLTETGASTSGNYARDGSSQAKYLANQLFDALGEGVSRLFVYQLIDGSGAAGDIEGNFGLFHHDGTPKPAARMLQGLQSLLNGGEGTRAPPVADGQALSIVSPATSEPDRPRRLLIDRPDGSVLLVLWNEPMIDDGHGHEMDPPAAIVTVTFDAALDARVHDLVDAAAAPAFANGGHATVTLRGYPMILELRRPDAVAR